MSQPHGQPDAPQAVPGLTRAVIPPWPDDPFVLIPSAVETEQERTGRLIREVERRFGGQAEAASKLQVCEPESYRPLEQNPAWERFGFRGQVAKLLFERGLERKAIRFVNCNRLGRPGVCQTNPEHRFYELHGCGVIFCRECGLLDRRRLFEQYREVIASALKNLGGMPHGWVLARINFTLRSDGSPITPEQVKKLNAAVRVVMRKTVGSPKGYGMLFIDEMGFEARGHIRERRAGGLNLHCHGLYLGPRLDWEKTRDLWMQETEKKFGVPSLGFYISRVRGFERNPERAVRWALNHMLKYVSKPPAVTAERLADLVSAFNGARRVHSLGLFYAVKVEPREKLLCPCPKCRADGIESGVAFDGKSLPNGGCIPRLVPIEDLKAQGYEDIRLAGRAAVLSLGQSGDFSGAGPP
jgi:hypothetical protein